MGFIRGKEKFFFGDPVDDFNGFSDYTHQTREKLVELSSSLFYTIVTNYSFQSLITQDFSKDLSTRFTDSGKPGVSSEGNWLDSLFRKNDGYVTPIVLNPYRESGKIDLQREYQLTLSRMSALLVQAEQHDKELLLGYRLATITYEVDHSHFLHKLFDRKKYNDLDDAIHLSEVMVATRHENTVARAILNAYEVQPPVLNNEIQIIPYAYLIYKTLSVLSKYGQFVGFGDIPNMTAFGELHLPGEISNYGAINCAECDVSEEVIKHDQYYICLNCLQVDDEIQVCGWCNEGNWRGKSGI